MRTVALISCLIAAVGAIAQTNTPLKPADAHPKFDVASIKPSAPGNREAFLRSTPGGRMSCANMTLKDLIVIAYRIQPFQITGGPNWLESARYDIEAKLDNPGKPGMGPRLLQSLLEDRFRLKLHRETKELPVYVLVLARKDGHIGANLTNAKEGNCAAPNQSAVSLDSDKSASQPCGLHNGRGNLSGLGVPMEGVATALSRILGRPVTNQTGLTGKFDVNVQYTPDENQMANLTPPGMKPPPPEGSGPSLFTAIQEQLGLRLESQKGPVEIFIVDGAQKATEN
jgi:uncharacterized protein (TIGR03435 family)